MDWPRLREEIVTGTAKVCRLLRALPTGDLPLARVSWTAAETGAHLVTLARRYGQMAQAPQPLPASLAQDNQLALDALPQRDPHALADLLTADVATLLDTLGSAGDRRVWYFTLPHTAYGLGAILLTELLMHGRDLARAIRQPWPVTRPQAATCLRGVLPALVLLVDPAAARAATGSYHLHLRGSHDWTIRIHDGTATVEPGRPARADLHLSADPVAFLLHAYGHLGRTRVVLTGRIIAWGRRPWLARHFTKAFTET